MRDLEQMQQDGYSSDDEFEDEEDAVNLHDEMEGAAVSAGLLEQEMKEVETRPTPASTVTRLPCAAHKVKMQELKWMMIDLSIWLYASVQHISISPWQLKDNK